MSPPRAWARVTPFVVSCNSFNTCGKIGFEMIFFFLDDFCACVHPPLALFFHRPVAPLQCTKLGSHLSTLLDHYQQFQEVAESLRTWLQESETTIGKLLSETVSSDPVVLQEQLASAKVRMELLGSSFGGAVAPGWQFGCCSEQSAAGRKLDPFAFFAG